MKHRKGDPAAWIRRVAKPGATVIDGGANVGGFTLAAAETVGESGRVFAVEPDPRCHAALDDVASRYPQVTVIKAALSAYAGVATLFRAVNTEQTSLWPNAVSHKFDEIEVTTYALDDIVKTGKVDAIKLDLQGGEPGALWDAEHVLTSCPQWCVEIWPSVLKDRAASVFGAFRQAGLTPRWMDDGDPVADWNDLAEWCDANREPSQHINILFTA